MMKARLEQAAFIFQFHNFWPLKIIMEDRKGHMYSSSVPKTFAQQIPQQVISTWKVLEDTHQQK